MAQPTGATSVSAYLPFIGEALKIMASATVGGLLGYFFARRKLHVSLLSLKPSALYGLIGYTVKLPETLHQKLKEFHWTVTEGRDFQETEDLALLHEQLKGTRLFLKAAERCKGTLDSATTKLAGAQLSIDDRRAMLSELCSYHVVQRLLTNLAKRRAIATAALPANWASMETLVPLSDEPIGAGMRGVSGRVILDFSTYSTALHYNDPMAREAMLRLGFHLANGDQTVLHGVFQRVKEQLLTDIALGTSVAAQVEPLIMENSRWTAEVQLTNHGQTPVILSTAAELHPKCGGKRYKIIVMDLVQNPQVRKGPGHEEDMTESEIALRSLGVSPDPTIDTKAEHLVIKPGDSVKAVFVSAAVIAGNKEGEELLDFWRKGMPSYRFCVVPVPRRLRPMRTASSARIQF